MGITTYSGSGVATIARTRKNWTLCSGPKTNATNTLPAYTGQLTSRIKYNNGYYYFAAAYGWMYYSTDGKNWFTSNTGIGGSTQHDVAFNGTVWVSLRSTSVQYSTNLITWSSSSGGNNLGASSANFVEWVPAWNLFVTACNNSTTSIQFISTSPDGNTWTTRSSSGITTSANDTFAYNPTTGTGVIRRSASALGYSYSTDGITWNATTAGASGRPYYIGGAINRFVSGEYSQTSASIAANWNSTIYTKVLQGYASNWSGNGGTTSYNSAAVPVFDSANNLLYVLDSQSNGEAYIKTFDCSQVITQYADPAGRTEISAVPILVEPVPDFKSQYTFTDVSLGYGNGVFIYATNDTEQGYVKIYTTAV